MDMSVSNTSTQIFPKSKTSFSRSTPLQMQCAPIDTIVNGNSHTIGSDNEYDTPDKRIHRTLPNIYDDWQRHKIYRTAENVHRYVHSNLITMNMQVSYAKNPIQNEARPHKIQVHLAPNGSQRRTTLVLVIKSHWRNTTPSHVSGIFLTAYFSELFEQHEAQFGMWLWLLRGFIGLEMWLDLGWKSGLVMWASQV